MSDPINLDGISLESALAIQARMVRKSIAPNQLVRPIDSDTVDALWSLANDIWRATAEVRTQHIKPVSPKSVQRGPAKPKNKEPVDLMTALEESIAAAKADRILKNNGG